jgi:hypothetical protein
MLYWRTRKEIKRKPVLSSFFAFKKLKFEEKMTIETLFGRTFKTDRNSDPLEAKAYDAWKWANDLLFNDSKHPLLKLFEDPYFRVWFPLYEELDDFAELGKVFEALASEPVCVQNLLKVFDAQQISVKLLAGGDSLERAKEYLKLFTKHPDIFDIALQEKDADKKEFYTLFKARLKSSPVYIAKFTALLDIPSLKKILKANKHFYKEEACQSHIKNLGYLDMPGTVTINEAVEIFSDTNNFADTNNILGGMIGLWLLDINVEDDVIIETLQIARNNPALIQMIINNNVQDQYFCETTDALQKLVNIVKDCELKDCELKDSKRLDLFVSLVRDPILYHNIQFFPKLKEWCLS